jgi:uridine phosphorylase
MACNSFYEEQGRLDGALCEYTEADQRRFLTRCRDELHVVNFEMESLTVASFCTRASIPCAVVCAVLVNRTAGDGDTPTAAAALLKEWEMRPVRVATAYVFKRLSERCKRGLA